MSFYEQYEKLARIPFEDIWKKKTAADVEKVLAKDYLDEDDFLTLLSPAAQTMLEETAKKARTVTERNFSKNITLFAPLYISDHCVNHCVYCSFNMNNEFPRTKLTIEEIAKEGRQIAASGIRHLLLLTGESPRETPISYFKEAIGVLKHEFDSLGIEIYPLNTDAYHELVEAGVSGLTIYQEVYNEQIYKDIHPKGPKRNYRYRLDAPERGCQAGMRSVNIGALLGMDDWRKEVFFTGMHARYLQERYPDTTISLSPPRMRPFAGSYQPRSIVEDDDLIQALLAFRLLLPRSGLTLSTREPSSLRDRLVHLGITKMSAGVSTQVGGYSNESAETVSQFQISDERGVTEICSMLLQSGFQPVVNRQVSRQPH